jgi:hypothetical protein
LRVSPEALRYPLRYWLEGVFGYRDATSGMRNQAMLTIATRTGIPVRESFDLGGVMPQILAACERDDDLFLDVVDATLDVLGGGGTLVPVLHAASSVWTVADGGKGLERRVDTTAVEALAVAVAPADAASAELQEAWTKVYGRTPDPSDAWDHAIKAVEHVLIPIVVPNNQRATLGTVLGQISSQPGQRTFLLNSSSSTVDGIGTLEAMLRLLWPNPDRHGGPAGASRTPTLKEAEAVVQLAVLVVQWTRSSVVA